MSHFLETLELAPFRQRFPWLGPDLQTLRDTLRVSRSSPDSAQSLEFALPDGDRLLARLDCPTSALPEALVVVVHGLGGCSDDVGQRRLARALSGAGCAVLRLNLRGAGPGRPLARGTYAANCTADLLPVLRACRRLARDLAPPGVVLPLGAVGISLGGTVLLNAQLASANERYPLLDALACISSPLVLARCADCFDRPRNRLYQYWMVRRLIAQTLADPVPLSAREREGLTGPTRPSTIRAFDALITAPRLGFADAGAYYAACSPLPALRQILQVSTEARQHPPALLLIHAKDDPWVPVDATLALAAEVAALPVHAPAGVSRPWPQLVITSTGGHCGFHASGDSPDGRWSDRLAVHWLRRVLFGDPVDLS